MIISRKSEALVETPRATRYLTQLCKHFAHEAEARPIRVCVEYDDHQASVNFGWLGECTMQAQPEGLQIHAAAGDPIRLRLVQQVIASHLERFGLRDELRVHWRRAEHMTSYCACDWRRRRCPRLPGAVTSRQY